MKTILLAAGVAATVLAAGSALASPKMGGSVAPPKQPIPYDQLGSYLKASPSQRAHKDWWSGQTAATGTPANTSTRAATAAPSPAMPNDTPTAGADMPAATSPAPADPKMPPDNMAPDKSSTSPMAPMDKPH